MNNEILTFANVAEYNNAKMMHDINHAATMEYLMANKTNAIPCEICATFPYAEKVTNELRSMLEVWEFMHDKPAKYFIYVDYDTKKAITWTGAKLGNIHFGTEYRSNMGDKRQPIDVYGINGIKYHGIYFKSSGNYARIKAYKTQSCSVY